MELKIIVIWGNLANYFFKPFMIAPLQPILSENIAHTSFDPHLLVDFVFLQPEALDLLTKAVENNHVHFMYDGKACKFYHHILNGNQQRNHSTQQMAIELFNPTLHHGQFMVDKSVGLALNGTSIAQGKIAGVLEPQFHYWDSTRLPAEVLSKRPVVSKEVLKTFLLNLEFDLIALDFIEDYEISVDKEAANFITLQLSVPNKTITQIQAQKLEQIFKEQGFDCCYYKTDYVPFSYGLLDILMQSYTATFATANKKNYITGIVKVV